MPEATMSAFLDEHGRYAKQAADIAEVRLLAEGGAVVQSMTYAEYKALPKDERTAIILMGSAAEYIDTDGKSNA